MIINVNGTTIRLSSSETIALYLLAKDLGLTPRELAIHLAFEAPAEKTMASYVRDYLTINLIRRTQ